MPRDFEKIFNAGVEGISLKCPKCGKGKIFKSTLRLKTYDNCTECNFDIKGADTGDGPAYIALCTSGVLIPVIAVLVEAIYSPSYLVHALLWLPALFIASWVVLLYSRSIFIALEYKIRELEKVEEPDVRKN